MARGEDAPQEDRYGGGGDFVFSVVRRGWGGGGSLDKHSRRN